MLSATEFKPRPFADVYSVNEGRSCGDYIRIDVEFREDGEVIIGAEVDACEYTRASTSWMIEEFRGKSKLEITERIEAFKRQVNLKQFAPDQGFWTQAIEEGRGNCILLPLESLQDALAISESGPEEPGEVCEVNPLRCDSCRISNKIGWFDGAGKVQKARQIVLDSPTLDVGEKLDDVWQLLQGAEDAGKIRSKVTEVVGGVFQISRSGNFTEDDLQFQKFCKVILSEDEEHMLREFARKADEREAAMIRSLRCQGIVDYHCRMRGITDVSPPLRDIFTKTTIRTANQRKVIPEIDQVIARNSIKAISVKAAFTRDLYPDTCVRSSNDMDYAVHDLPHALRFYSSLVSEGYEIEKENDIPFSIKIVLDENQNEVIVGHFHSHRSLGIYDRQKMIVDVNFPGIPLGLLDTVHYDFEGDEAVQQFVITLTHLFKHEIGFMKDINDLFIMFENHTVKDAEALLRELQHYDLVLVAGLTIRFLEQAFSMDSRKIHTAKAIMETLSDQQQALIQGIIDAGWPYTISSHSFCQAVDIFQRRHRKFGRQAAIEGINFLFSGGAFGATESGPASLVQSSKMFNVPMFTRVDLIPILVFSRPVGKSVIEEIAQGITEVTVVDSDDEEYLLMRLGSQEAILSQTGFFLMAIGRNVTASREDLHRLTMAIHAGASDHATVKIV